MASLHSPRWYSLTATSALEKLDTSEQGLSSSEAAARLKIHGYNDLPHEPPPTPLEILLRQFKSPLIYILLIAASISLMTGQPEDAAFIGVVLLINASIGGYQELRAEKSSRALQHLLHTQAHVLRDGNLVDIDAEELVPGDVIQLESGGRVPADVRLLSAQALECDESFLTGESFPVAKQADWHSESEVDLGEQLSMAFAGAMVVRGRARGVVVATGLRTVVGELAVDVMGSTGGEAPLIERMAKFTKVIALTVLIATVIVSVVGVVVHGYAWEHMVLFGVALAVSAIPEGLPIAMTVALSVATTRMVKRGVIVRRLAAVEGLGSCTMIASDKTGTLTCNELTCREAVTPDRRRFTIAGEGFAPIGEVLCDGSPVDLDQDHGLRSLAACAILCNEGDLRELNGEWTWLGDPTDIALLSLGEKLGLSRAVLIEPYPQVGAIPFEPERQFAATFHRSDAGTFIFVKGAPERILAMCEDGDPFATEAAAMAERGLRVLGFAAAQVDDIDETSNPSGLQFLGFIGMIDPLRPGAKEAVAECQRAGITVSMITGDHPVTALAIARELGFADHPSQVVTGADLVGKTEAELAELVKHARVFARTTPRDKLNLVGAARASGHFVAVTGDGVNDAPALRAANIGVAMGKSGTDVAREASELVIADDQFSTIIKGVEEGRVAYDNVRKVIYLAASTGAAEVLILALAMFSGWPNNAAGLVLPLIPVQLLWLNLVTNGIQDVALAFEPQEGDVLARPPRRADEPIFDRLMIERIILAAGVMTVVAYGVFGYLIEVARWEDAQARNVVLLLMVLFQNVHIGNCRSETISGFRLSPFRSPILLGGVLLACGTHLAAMHIPLTQRLLKIEPVDFRTFATMFGLAVTVFLAMEVHKWWRKRRPVST